MRFKVSCFFVFLFSFGSCHKLLHSNYVNLDDDDEDVFTFFCEANDGIRTTTSVQYSFKTIEAPTDKFSDSNLIGQG